MKRNQREPKFHQYFFDTEMVYGKYRGSTIKEILSHDPGYLRWMMTIGAKFHPKVIKKMVAKIKAGRTKEFFDRVERNWYPGSIAPDKCPVLFPEIDLLQIDGIPLIMGIEVEKNLECND